MTAPDVTDLSRWLEDRVPAEWLDAGPEELDSLRAGQRAWQELVDVIGPSGLWAATWPEEYGGLGLDEDAASAVEAVLHSYGVHRRVAQLAAYDLAGPAIMEFGTPEQQERHLRAIATGAERWCQLFSEPDAGSDLASLTTRAQQREDGTWYVEGVKIWSSFAQVAHRGLLLARTDTGVRKHRGITCFLLDMSSDGVDVRPLRQMSGAAEFNEVVLDGVVVPDSDRLGEPGQGWRVAMTILGRERSSMPGRERVGNGPASELARSTDLPASLCDEALALAVRECALQMANERAALDPVFAALPAEASGRKVLSALLFEDLARTAVKGLRGDGAWWETQAPPEPVRQYLEAKNPAIAGGVTEIQLDLLAQARLGLPRELDPDRDTPFRERGRR